MLADLIAWLDAPRWNLLEALWAVYVGLAVASMAAGVWLGLRGGDKP